MLDTRFPQTTVSTTLWQDPVDKAHSLTPLSVPTLQSQCSPESQDAQGTYLKDLVVLSALLAGWAPGDSFRRLKMASLFFMSLALEVEKRVDQLSPHQPLQTWGTGGRGLERGGTYSFMVCRLCRFPLRVRYMPRSISEECPHLETQVGVN